MKKLRVAIIGQGRSGRGIHGKYFLGPENDRYEVVAVSDLIEGRRERAAREYGCDVYADYREIFARRDIDLVVNSTYSHLHYPITEAFLSHGFNVVVEKPFAGCLADCEAMIRTAGERGVMLSVFQQSHLAPYYRRIREIIASGVLGRLIEVELRFSGFSRRWDWQCSQRCCGGNLLNNGPHPMEQALDLLDSDEMPVICSRLDRVNTFGDAEDYAKILLLLPGKPVVDIEISSCDAYNDFLYKIQGSNGGLKATASHIEYRYFKPGEAQEQKLTFESLSDENGEPTYCGEQLKWYTGEENPKGNAFDSAVVAYYNMIYDHLINGGELVIRPEKIARVIAVMDEIHRQNPLSRMF